jgi:pimeloyl-ACP methyl ester carboxylesterase
LIEAMVANLEGYVEQTEPPDARLFLVWGADDPVFPLVIAERLADLWPSAELVVIDDARHAPNLEHPEAFNATLAGFLARD